MFDRARPSGTRPGSRSKARDRAACTGRLTCSPGFGRTRFTVTTHSKPPGEEDELRVVAVKLDARMRARLDALAKRIPVLDGAVAPNRSMVLRLVIVRGLADAEKEFGS
jgi:hypothetical protein